MLFRFSNLIPFSLLIILIIGIVDNTQSQEQLDSLLQQRTESLFEYKHFKDGMDSRTWIKLVELNQLGDQLILEDNFIIEYYLEKERKKLSEQLKINEQLKNEISLLKKDIELRNIEIKEVNAYQRFFSLGLAFFFLLSLIFLILFIEKHLRYRSFKNNQSSNKNYKILFEEAKINIDELELHNKELEHDKFKFTSQKEKIEILEKKLKASEESLNEERGKRKDVEKQIKEIINQISTNKD